MLVSLESFESRITARVARSNGHLEFTFVLSYRNLSICDSKSKFYLFLETGRRKQG